VEITPLAVPGAWLCTPRVFPDDRGSFREWFRADLLAAATGRRFDVVQANHSVSARDVVRGVHYSDVPPGQAKLVCCMAGSALDLIVDLRVGSPTFGAVDTVQLDPTQSAAVFLSEGLGHGFRALQDATAIVYLVSSLHDPAREHALRPTDPMFAPLAEPVAGAPCRLSPRDAAAPDVATAMESGALPDYAVCVARYAELTT
jgi:dTDP-4-dehydrorhamnose 3,5-epimerase